MNTAGTLYVVATPIGNLEDITIRAIRILKEVDLIAAEDTRHSRKLLHRYGISTRMIAFHQHNQTSQTNRVIELLARGKSIALISDAGTPLISDPGQALVEASHAGGVSVVPVPGASALTCALSAFGVSLDNLIFAGFLPARQADRRARLNQLRAHRGTIVFYEAPHRILRSVEDMRMVFGASCEACIAREMTKIHEAIRRDTLDGLVNWVTSMPSNQKGEFVIAIVSVGPPADDNEEKTDHMLNVLMGEMSASKSAQVASRLRGVSRNALYRRALELKDDSADR
ncbi:MAG: 16S rRNA (cytidine(1402)-2'-O)-methyltransferase [Acidiferrobacterales bacterium]|nr:16S rRNA (cytidine(1402)-2'-O)-methyltransferase [Acidiferrobacterales bacterium]